MLLLNDFIQICDGRREIDIRNRKKDADEDDQQFTVSFMVHYILILYNVIFWFKFYIGSFCDRCYLYYETCWIFKLIYSCNFALIINSISLLLPFALIRLRILG